MRLDGMERGGLVSTDTLRLARAVAIASAVLLVTPMLLSFVFPTAFLIAPYHRVYERMLAAVLGALALALLLVLRDPVRNAGVFAVIGLTAGTLDAAIVYSLVFDGLEASHWFVQVPLLGIVAAALVFTYLRLRRPHPVIVRIVVAAIVLLPVLLFVHDKLYRALVSP